MKGKIVKVVGRALGLLLMLAIFVTTVPPGMVVEAASAPGGIYNYGLGGIYIDIKSAPYSTMKTNNQYGAKGCTWFVACRARQITGNNRIGLHSAENWPSVCGSYGFTPGSTPKAPAIICCTGSGTHVAILEKIEGNTAYISEGGRSAIGSYYGYCTIRKCDVSQIASIYRGWGVGNISYVYLSGSPSPSKPTHTHSWTTAYEGGHPHRAYHYCSCGAKEYTGGTRQEASCSSCYPVGNVRLTRSFSRTGRTATFYRNNVTNANQYTLTLYKNGSFSNSYSMSSSTYNLNNLPSGTYTAQLIARNGNTGQERIASCASFTIVDSYQVTYSANGGTGAPSAQTKIRDENMTITSSIPKKKGHIFKGWASGKTATEAQYQPGGVYTKNTPITLYAVWEPETYIIKFDLNGGNGNIEDTTITYGNTMRMPNSVVKESFYLRGWAEAKDASVPDYRIGEDCGFEKDSTLYAVWGNSTWGGAVASGFAGGDGTQNNPYQIANASQLAYLANKVNQQTSEPTYEYYVLTDNINLGYEEWVPIGVHDTEYQYFCGSLDGNGYTVSDLSISQVNTGNLGLFGYTKDSEIKNMNVAGEIVSLSTSSALNIGAVTGYADNTKINNCSALYFNISDLSAGTDTSCVGCVAGRAVGGEISGTNADNCYINLKDGSFKAGIIVGKAETNISDCTVTSKEELFGTNANINSLHIGGICGELSGNITKCTVNAGFLSNSIRSSSAVYAGGLVGSLSGKANVCTARFTSDAYTNSITINSSSSSAGGLIGISSSDSRVVDCMYDGKTISSETSSYAYTGGLLGRANAQYTKTITAKGGQTLSRAELPTRSGYTATWYTDSELKQEYDFTQPVSSDMTLYAKWTEGSDNIEIWDGTSSEPAYNADTKTYTVKNGKELAWVSDVTNGVITSGTNFPESITFEGYTIELAKDIYLNDTTDWENWGTNPPKNEWKSISNLAGTFDGKGCTVNGLYNCGLFGTIKDTGLVCNLSASEGYIEDYFCGGVITRYNYGTISNCKNSCIVKVVFSGYSLDVGGIAECNYGTIKNCLNTGKIYGEVTDTSISNPTANAGGIAGKNRGIIENCYNTGTVDSRDHIMSYSHSGGIVGEIIGDSSVKYCYNSGVITGPICGGIVGAGESYYTSTSDKICYTTISNCYNTGAIGKSNSSNMAGGIVGEIVDIHRTASFTVSNCYNTGSVNALSAYDYIGGIVGAINIWNICKLQNCYATRSKLYTVLPNSNRPTTTSVSYKSSSAMKSLSNLSGFSTTDWGVDSSINNGYPYLKSMESTYKNYTITVIEDAENSAAISRSFVNIDGDVSGTSTGSNAYTGGILGFASANNQSSAHSDAVGLLSIAASVEAKTSAGSYYACSGDIVGNNSDNPFSFDNVHTYSNLNVKATNSGKAANAETSNIGTSRTKTQITRSSFLRGVFGPETYQSLNYLKEHPDAVWVVRDGELPELYCNILRDITISNVEHGSISVDKAQAVDDEIVTVTAVPDAGYQLNTIYVNGKEITGSTFSVESDSDVYATFTEETPEYNIKVSADDKAGASLVNVDAAESSDLVFAASSDNISALDGDEIRVEAQAATDYTVDTIRVNGEEIAGDSFIVTADSVVTLETSSTSTDIAAETYDAKDIYGYYATLGGYVGEADGVSRYIRYWKSSNPNEVFTTEVEDGAGEYYAVADDLEPGTEYSYRMCDSGIVKTFVTLDDGVYIGTPEEFEEDPVPSPEQPSSPTPTPIPTTTPVQTEEPINSPEPIVQSEWQIAAFDGSSVSITVPDGVEPGKKIYIFLAKYDGDVLTDSDVLTYMTTDELSCTLSANKVLSGSVKVMLWDENYAPLCEAREFYN